MIDLATPATPETIEAALQEYSRLSAYVGGLKAWILDFAREYGGLSYGGEQCNGKPVGALNVYETRTVYKLYPDPDLVAEYDCPDDENARARLAEMYTGKNPAHFMSWLRRRDDWHKIEDYLKAHAEFDDGLLTKKGEWTLDIRVNPPDETVEVRTKED